MPILNGRELSFIDPSNGHLIASFNIAKRHQVLAGNIDSLAGDIPSLGRLDLMTVDPKMIWSPVTNSALSALRFGRRGNAALCEFDQDGLADYAVSQGRNFLVRRSSSGQEIRIRLNKLGTVHEVLCGKLENDTDPDQLVVLHEVKVRSSKQDVLSKTKSKATKQIVISVLDANGAILESRQTSARKAQQLVLADIDGNGINELCVLEPGKRQSRIICEDQNGQESVITASLSVNQISAGDFTQSSNVLDAPIDEFAVITKDNRLFILAPNGGSTELTLSGVAPNKPGGKINPKLLEKCR